MYKKVMTGIFLFAAACMGGPVFCDPVSPQAGGNTGKKAGQSIEKVTKEAESRHSALIKRLQEGKITEVKGIVGLDSPSGGPDTYAGKKTWTLFVVLHPWSCLGGKIEERKLTVRKTMLLEAEFNTLMKQIEPHDTLSLRVRLDRQSFGDPGTRYVQALLLEITGKGAPDKQLQQRMAELRKPIILDDGFFGALVFDRLLDQFEGKRKLGGDTYSISIYNPGGGTKIDARSAQKRVEYFEANLPGIRKKIAARMFDLYNSNWQSLGKLSLRDFMGKIKLDAVSLSTSGDMEIYFSDGGLFEGHSIIIAVDKKDCIHDPHL